MKRFIVFIAVLFSTLYFVNAQVSKSILPKVGVINLDSKGISYDPIQAGNITRIELDKLGLFDVIDKYDIDFLLDKDVAMANNCYGKSCLTEIGKKIKADKMLTGNIEILSERIYVTLRMLDITNGTIEKSQVLDFLNVKDQVQNMIGLTLKKMYNLPIDEALLTQLTKVDAFNSKVNTPDEDRLNLSGPRMGMAFFTGRNAQILKDPENLGGYDMYPAIFQFGYQLEVQYLGAGNFQALAEFLPMISGLDQGKVIPSITILNGLRDSRYGLEFAFGPTFLLGKKAEGYYEKNAENVEVWHLESEWKGVGAKPNIVTRSDSRGNYRISPGFLFAFGKTFRSGRLNIPINVYIRPDYKNGSQYGISFGFNAKGG